MSSLVGQNFGRYQILEVLGEGGMATVYKAYDTRLEREVAIKVIRRDAFPQDQMEMLLKRFERESKSLAKLSHPNIVGVMDYGEHDGSPYLVMEYLSGGTLRQRLGNPIPWREAVQLILPIAYALEYVHDRNIINRDVKPSNVLMTEKGQPMLTDFGLVKVFGDEAKEGTHLTSSGTGLGTPDYMAPEQWTGETTTQSDLYSFGVILYEMITGHRPYTADTPAGVLLKQATEPLPLPTRYVSNLPRDVESVLLKALAKDPGDRYPDMHTLINELQNLLAGKSVEASLTKTETLREKMTGIVRPAATSVAAPKPAQTRSLVPILVGVGIVGLILIAGLAALVFGSGMLAAPTPTQKAPPPTPSPVPTNTQIPPTETALPTFTPTVAAATAAPTETPFLTEIKDEHNVTMIYVPAGEFTMGSDTSGDVSARPAHKVKVEAFYIDKYEVTNELYDACAYAVECRKPTSLGSVKRNTYYKNPVFKNYPVVYVTWKMAEQYCEWRGGRLPTEAEWEKAARGADDERVYPWDSGELSCAYANYQSCNGDTTPVDQYGKGTSPYGLYDMAGNVWEWTSTIFLPYPYDATDGREDFLKSGERVIRGGGWGLFLGSSNVRVDTRLKVDWNYSGPLVGFRCVRPVAP